MPPALNADADVFAMTKPSGIADIYGGMDRYFVSPTTSPTSVRR